MSSAYEHRILENKVIFVHIPRTGGTSVARAIGISWGCHVQALAYKKRFGKLWDQLFSFTIIRNTWDRISSWYKFHYDYKDHYPEYDMPFNEWVLRGCITHYARAGDSRDWCVLSDDPLRQIPFFIDQNGEIIVNAIWDYPNINTIPKYMKIKFGIQTYPMETCLQTNCNHVSCYNRDAAEYVLNRYNDEIKLFGFKFGGDYDF